MKTRDLFFRNLDRMDIVVRMMYIMDKINYGTSYMKMQQLRTNDDSRKHEEFDKLIASMREDGFDDRYPIQVARGFRLVDGSHRLACALAFGIDDVPIEMVAGKGVKPYGGDWFIENGFPIAIVTHLEKQKVMAMRRFSASFFGGSSFYQGLHWLQLEGQRPSDIRFSEYQLSDFLRKRHRVLDVGSNTGFMSHLISYYVKEIVCVEADPVLSAISAEVSKYFNVNNKTDLAIDFKQFKSKVKFDVIVSLAVHNWVGMKFEDYIARLGELATDDGILVFETHNLETFDMNPGYTEDAIERVFPLNLYKRRVDDQGRSRNFYIYRR